MSRYRRKGSVSVKFEDAKFGVVEFELMSYNHGVSMPLIWQEAISKSVPSSRSVHQDFTFSRYIDEYTPLLNFLCSCGKEIEMIILKVSYVPNYEDEGEIEVHFLEYVFTECIITSVSIGGGSGDCPAETITFMYQKISWQYTSPDKIVKTAEWDIVEGTGQINI